MRVMGARGVMGAVADVFMGCRMAVGCVSLFVCVVMAVVVVVTGAVVVVVVLLPPLTSGTEAPPLLCCEVTDALSGDILSKGLPLCLRGLMEEYAGLFLSIRPSVLLTAWSDGGGRQDVALSMSLCGTLFSGGTDGLLLGMPDLCPASTFLPAPVGLPVVPFLLLLSSDSLRFLVLLRVPVPLSSGTLLTSCTCGVIINVSRSLGVLSLCPWVVEAMLGTSFKSFRSSGSPSVGEDTLTPDLHLVAFMLLGRRGELWGVGDSGGTGVRV